jgi:hypothetical protein
VAPYFDVNQQRYYPLIENRRFSDAVNDGLSWLEFEKRSNPTRYATEPKGTPFYFLGIAAFASHDYQTAAFFFDAAVAEDIHHYPGDNDKPALMFMRLEARGEAATPVVEIIVKRLGAALDDYHDRDGSRRSLTLPDVREHFLNHLERPHLRTLTTAFVSFLAEWDYRLQMIDLPTVGVSREPFFTHLFRGCLLFESLLRDKAPLNPPESWSEYFRRKLRLRTRVRHNTLGYLLRVHRNALNIGRVRTSSSSFEGILSDLRSREPLRGAIRCTARTRNTLGHDLAWVAQSLDRQSYNLLASNISASCLHAIARLYVP